ncbi:MAG: YbjN domain-containing protein [Cyclobacteriaceae bacterium]|nr:hypothetical protein [Cyclobacteriaceae bacterium]MCH8517008.1 YbjN domain-containing protein [Cyclobacteriaceae bacterium]
MKFNEFMGKFADEINGSFLEYDDKQSIITIPLSGNRYQRVVGRMHDNNSNGGPRIIEFTSKVCQATKEVDFKRLLMENTNFIHGKFSIIDDYVNVESSVFLENVTESMLKEIILEVGQMADKWEYELTGMDIH